MELNHVNLPVAHVSATRDFFEKGPDLEQTIREQKRSKPRLRTELQRPKIGPARHSTWLNRCMILTAPACAAWATRWGVVRFHRHVGVAHVPVRC